MCLYTCIIHSCLFRFKIINLEQTALIDNIVTISMHDDVCHHRAGTLLYSTGQDGLCLGTGVVPAIFGKLKCIHHQVYAAGAWMKWWNQCLWWWLCVCNSCWSDHELIFPFSILSSWAVTHRGTHSCHTHCAHDGAQCCDSFFTIQPQQQSHHTVYSTPYGNGWMEDEEEDKK